MASRSRILELAKYLNGDGWTEPAEILIEYASILDELEAAREEVESMRNDRDGALYFIRLNGHELQHADGLLAARDRRQKLIGAAEEWELEAGIAKAAGRDRITYQREYLEQRAAKLRQEAEDGK